MLCGSPILSLPEGIDDFVVYCDTSNQGLGCVLMQREKNHNMPHVNSRYMRITTPPTNLELGTIVFALKSRCHYLYRVKCIFYTDHKSLHHILDQKELNMRQRRWLELLNDYECEIRYHPGKANVIVDNLSCKERIKPRRVKALSMTIQSNLILQIRNA